MNLRGRNKVKLEGNMASMTDMVFLLLIFFIIMATMANSVLPVNLPSVEGSGTTNKSPYNIGITEDNQYFVEEDTDQYLTLDELEQAILKKVIGNESPTLRINADKDCKWDYVIKVLGMAQDREWEVVVVKK